MINPQSNYLSVLANNWACIPTEISEHRLDKNQVCALQEQSPQIIALKQKYPQINVQIDDHRIKKLSKGIYIGALNQQNKPHGYGMIRYDDGSIMQAKFVDGSAHGKGFILYTPQQYYVGDFLDNNFDGRGEFHSPQFSYIGQFRNNKFQGNGQLTFSKNNATFIGKMEEGYMKQGTLSWEVLLKRKNSRQAAQRQKYQYKGSFKDNKFDDQNAQLTSKVGVYRGGFKNGMKQGKGVFQFFQKYQYVGQYSKNLKSGYGTLYNPQITKRGDSEVCQFSQLQKNISYRGEFRNNIPHGKGQIYQEQTKSLKQAQYIQGIWAEIINSTR